MVVRGRAAAFGARPRPRSKSPASPSPSVSAYRDSSLYSTPRSSQEKNDEFFAKLRTCHTLCNEFPSYEPPPSKRRRGGSVFSQRSESDEDLASLFPRRSSQSSLTPRGPRQVTLDSLRNWKLPERSFTQTTSSIQSTPASMRRNSNSFEDLYSYSGRTPTTTRCQSNQLESEFPAPAAFPPVMPQSVKNVLEKRAEESRVKAVQQQHIPTTTKSVSVSSEEIFKTPTLKKGP